jgi:hypothetical protein
MAKPTRLIPAHVFVAKSLEDQADLLPPGSTEEAMILRKAAALYRGFPDKGMVYVHEEKEDVNQAAARIVREATERS